MILNPKGEVLADSFNDKKENLGCPSTAEEVDVFAAKLKKSAKMDDNELQAVRNAFLKRINQYGETKGFAILILSVFIFRRISCLAFADRHRSFEK